MMDAIKVIGIGIVTLVFSIILKEYRKDFAIYVVIIGGALILFFSLDTIQSIITLVSNLENKTSLNTEFIKLLVKLTGISILIEFAISICKDSGETAIAKKIELGGKIIVISMSIPVISGMLNGLLELLA